VSEDMPGRTLDGSLRAVQMRQKGHGGVRVEAFEIRLEGAGGRKIARHFFGCVPHGPRRR
jgi:hypothetical protein